MMSDYEPVVSGVIVVDKPEGLTSFRIVSMIRKLCGVKKVGHSGTLDPFATGVLPICVGKATRLIRYLEHDDKEYRCTIRFGRFSETQDTEGVLYGGRKPTEEELHRMKKNDYSDIREIFDAIPGTIQQIPPIYSAVKVNGRKAYEYARKGQHVELMPRTVHIYSCTILKIDSDPELEVDFLISCSKGTYIRSICEELGKKTGFGAYALCLRRTRSGCFSLDHAHTPEEIDRAANKGALRELFLPEKVCVRHLPSVDLTRTETEHIRYGRILPLSDFTDRINVETDNPNTDQPRFCAMYHDKLIAIVYPAYEGDSCILKIERMLDEL